MQPEDVRVFYEGRYMSIRAAFDGSNGITYLKPHIAIDCFLGTVELEPEIKNISSMVKVVLGDTECDHQYFPVPCITLDETAAEKSVALSRRVLDAHRKPRDSDKHLVRHLYDLYQLKQKNCLSANYDFVLKRVLEKEKEMFDIDLSEAHKNMDTALQYLLFDTKWKEHWNFFLDQVVYQAKKPSFEQAITTLEKI